MLPTFQSYLMHLISLYVKLTYTSDILKYDFLYSKDIHPTHTSFIKVVYNLSKLQCKKCASGFYVHALYRMTHEHVLSVRNHNKKIRHNAKLISNSKLEY